MSEVTPFDVKEWLKSFGLEAYKQSFLENGYETKKLCSNLKCFFFLYTLVFTI